jgi:hypothetical protein
MAGWGKTFNQQTTSWPQGVHASAMADLIPGDAAARALNASWEQIGDQSAIVRKRRGCRPLNTTKFGSRPVQQHYFQKRESNGSFTHYHLLFGEGGSLSRLNTDGSLTNYSSVGFNGPGDYISAQTANNRVYAVAGVTVVSQGATGNGLKFDGTTWSVMGISLPGAVSTVVATGAGVMSGTYDVALVYYNSATGEKSGRGPETTVTAANQQLAVSWSAPNDPQITDVIVCLRKQEISVAFYEAATVSVSSLSTTLNIDDDEYNALITKAPEPVTRIVPSGVKSLAWHRSRMFAATDTNIYYSEIEFPEQFDPTAYETANPDDGEKVVAIKSVYDQLVIFKDNSLYALIGDGPNDWIVRMVSRNIGCVAPNSIVEADGTLYWWSQQGPVIWDGTGEPVRLGETLVWDLVSPDAVNVGKLAQIFGVVDYRNERILWAFPEIGYARNSTLLPYKYRLPGFEGYWRIVDVASMVQGEDTLGQQWVYIGGYNGRIYRLWDGDIDGVGGGTYTGTTTGVSGLDYITGTGFNTSFGADDLYVYLVDSAGTILPRRRVVSNTDTELVLDAEVTGLTVGDTYTYYLGAIDFQVDTRWEDNGAPFHKKRYEFLYLDMKTPAVTTLICELSYDFAEASPQVISVSLSPGVTGGVWDQAIWDVDYWGGVQPTHKRIRVARVGRHWRARIRHIIPNVPMTLLKVGMRGELLTDKR